MKHDILSTTVLLLAITGVVVSLLYLSVATNMGDLSGISGAIATILSILLAVISIWYTHRTNIEPQAILEDIKRQNGKLVEKINLELRRNNFNADNIDGIADRLIQREPN